MNLTQRLLTLTLTALLSTPLAMAQQTTPATSSTANITTTPAPVTYRINYTLTEMDGGKRVGTQHLALIVITGGRSTVKQGSKVPIATGSYNNGAGSAAGTQTQFTYLDIGLNIDSSLDELPTGIRLRTKVEQSGVSEEKMIADVQEPVIRQTVMELSALVIPGKPLILGSLDIPGTTRHLDIEVMIEPVK